MAYYGQRVPQYDKLMKVPKKKPPSTPVHESTTELIRRVEARRKRRNLLLTGITILLIVAVGVIVALFWPASGSLSVGSAAPDFTLKEVSAGGFTGNTITLSSKQGSVILMEFMVSWCSHCHTVAPTVEEVYLNYTGAGVFVLAVAETWTSASGATANLASTQSFIQQHSSQYKYVLDETGAAARSYGVDGTPTFFVIDRSGRVSSILIGEQSSGSLSNAVEAALRR